MKETSLSVAIAVAVDRGIVDRRVIDRNFRRRAHAAFVRNQSEPGDCAGLPLVLLGLSVAEAYVGRSAGWIPEVQRIGCQIADALKA